MLAKVLCINCRHLRYSKCDLTRKLDIIDGVTGRRTYLRDWASHKNVKLDCDDFVRGGRLWVTFRRFMYWIGDLGRG